MTNKKISPKLEEYTNLGPVRNYSMSELMFMKDKYDDLIVVEDKFLYAKPKGDLEKRIDKR